MEKMGEKNYICFVCAEDDLFADLKYAFLAKGVEQGRRSRD